MASDRRVALVTGGAKRVGRAIVERLADAGYDVAFTYFASEREAELLNEKYPRGGPARVAGVYADFTDPQAWVGPTVDAVRREFGRLDVLVNNASLYESSKLSDSTVELTRRLMAIHLETPMLLCRAFEPELRAARGHVVNMVDQLAERPRPSYLAYSASKAALANLTLGLARELSPEVTVNGIAPGAVAWPEQMPEERRQLYLKRVPLRRPGTPTDVAELVHFLCTGGTYITGQILRLDGGRSVR